MTRKKKFNDLTSVREKKKGGFSTYFLKLERGIWISL